MLREISMLLFDYTRCIYTVDAFFFLQTCIICSGLERKTCTNLLHSQQTSYLFENA